MASPAEQPLASDPLLDARLNELETKLGLGENHIDELNRTVYRQQQQLELLQAQLREIYRMLQPVADEAPDDPRDQKPPHY